MGMGGAVTRHCTQIGWRLSVAVAFCVAVGVTSTSWAGDSVDRYRYLRQLSLDLLLSLIHI